MCYLLVGTVAIHPASEGMCLNLYILIIYLACIASYAKYNA